MRWDRLFDDLEDQLASEQDAERALLAAESERLRLARLTLRARLAALAGGADDVPVASFELADASRRTGSVVAVGADWVALQIAGARAARLIVPLAAVRTVTPAPGSATGSLRGEAGRGLSDRLTWGFAIRDLARRRTAVTIGLIDARVLTGTIDRAGVDHLDLAEHEPGTVRRAAQVTACRLIPFASVVWVGVEGWAAT